MSDDPNHHFPVMTIEELNEKVRREGTIPPRDEYPVDGEGYLLKTPEENFANLIYHDQITLNDIPERFREKTAELVELLKLGKRPPTAEKTWYYYHARKK